MLPGVLFRNIFVKWQGNIQNNIFQEYQKQCADRMKRTGNFEWVPGPLRPPAGRLRVKLLLQMDGNFKKNLVYIIPFPRPMRYEI